VRSVGGVIAVRGPQSAQSVPRAQEPKYSVPGPPSSQSPSEAQTHVSEHAFGTYHPSAVLSMPQSMVGLLVRLPTYASSWSPRSLAASTPVKLAAVSTVPGGTSETPFLYVRWESPGRSPNGPFTEVHVSSVT